MKSLPQNISMQVVRWTFPSCRLSVD
jgi:hypothetical protein